MMTISIKYVSRELEDCTRHIPPACLHKLIKTFNRRDIQSISFNSMATPNSLPLCERIPRKNTAQRAVDIIILLLLLSLLIYRFLFFIDHGLTWMLAFLCESWFTFIWVLVISNKWSPVGYKTYPDNLLPR
jgi:hypothetical protein